MAVPSRRALRERFDDAADPHHSNLVWTHRRDLYLATDAAVRGDRVGIAAIAERTDGTPVGAWSARVPTTENNDAELRALHFGLDRLAVLTHPGDRVGVLLDHDELAAAVAACCDPEVDTPRHPPFRTASPNHWGGIIARIARLHDIRFAVIESPANPAHELANRRSVPSRPR